MVEDKKWLLEKAFARLKYFEYQKFRDKESFYLALTYLRKLCELEEIDISDLL